LSFGLPYFFPAVFQAGAMVPAIFQPLAFRQFHQVPPTVAVWPKDTWLDAFAHLRQLDRHLNRSAAQRRQKIRSKNGELVTDDGAEVSTNSTRSFCSWHHPLHSPWFGIGFSMQALD
jgi:hypothetical protein